MVSKALVSMCHSFDQDSSVVLDSYYYASRPQGLALVYFPDKVQRERKSLLGPEAGDVKLGRDPKRKISFLMLHLLQK